MIVRNSYSDARSLDSLEEHGGIDSAVRGSILSKKLGESLIQCCRNPHPFVLTSLAGWHNSIVKREMSALASQAA
jgi:hypothetical protein